MYKRQLIDHVCRDNRHIWTFQREASAEGLLGSAKRTMEKTVQSNEGILHISTFQRNASAENLGEAEVYEMHYEENVALNNFSVMPRQSLLLVVTYTPGGGYVGNTK